MSQNVNGRGSVGGWWRTLWHRRADRERETYRRLVLQLHYELCNSGAPRSVLLVTPTASAACAQSSLLLACSAASELRCSVLLVDACPRDPATSRLLDCGESHGFAELLSDPRRSLDEMVLPTSWQNVSFLPAGSDILSTAPEPSEQQAALSRAVESPYDFNIFSGGAVLSDSTALALAPHVGCVLLTVVENETRMADLDAAQDALSLCRPRKLGLLLTTPVRRSMRRFAASENHSPTRETD